MDQVEQSIEVRVRFVSHAKHAIIRYVPRSSPILCKPGIATAAIPGPSQRPGTCCHRKCQNTVSRQMERKSTRKNILHLQQTCRIVKRSSYLVLRNHTLPAGLGALTSFI